MQAVGFVIHLARARQRRAHVAALQRLSPVPLAVIDAVDGAKLSDAAIAAVYASEGILQPRYPFDISKGEIGCFLSHRKAWQAIVDSGADAGLVFEDDAVVDPDIFPKALAAALGWMGRGDMVEFQTRPIEGAVVAELGPFRMLEPEVPPVRLSAQLIGVEAAQRLLTVTGKFDRPVDGVVQLLGVTRQRVLCIMPSGVRDGTEAVGGTTIQKKGTALLHQIGKSWHRAAYRRAVRAHVRAVRADQA
jgi:glycosyl transferase, family 25